MIKKFILTVSVAAWSCVSSQAQTAMAKNYKDVGNANPLSSCVFCADPTAIEYEGRVYVYGTNDLSSLSITGRVAPTATEISDRSWCSPLPTW